MASGATLACTFDSLGALVEFDAPPSFFQLFNCQFVSITSSSSCRTSVLRVLSGCSVHDTLLPSFRFSEKSIGSNRTFEVYHPKYFYLPFPYNSALRPLTPFYPFDGRFRCGIRGNGPAVNTRGIHIRKEKPEYTEIKIPEIFCYLHKT